MRPAPAGLPRPSECPRQSEAGAYLLGALGPFERAEYARHLPDCPACLGEVGQLAGLPGLLARSPAPGPSPDAGPGVAAPGLSTPRHAEAQDPVAAAVAEIRRARARRRSLVVAAFVLLAAVGVGAVLVEAGVRPATGVTAAAVLPVAMQAVGGAPVTATLELTQRPWGTQVVMRCRYRGAAIRQPVYTLVATAADGSRTELARWTALPDQDVVLATATDLSGPRLAELEVRNAAGTVLLRADQLS